jgi:hypothetical protein
VADELAGCGKTLARTGVDLILCRRIAMDVAHDAWNGP